MSVPVPDAAWVEAFHAGDRRTLETLYREHFTTVERAVGRVLGGADQETVIHAIFLDLCASEKMRRSFRSGSVSAWLRTVARNRALDHVRRYRRESLLPPGEVDALTERAAAPPEDRLALDQLVRTLHETLPEKLRVVFDARFVEQLSQREAARRLGIRRTTLVYREHRVRKVLQRWAQKGDLP